MLNNSVILITGGTGSFGAKFTQMTLEKFNPKKIIIYSRDEMKQWKMKDSFKKYEKKIRYFIGDIRDEKRLKLALKNVDYVVHAAALKIVPVAEYDPIESVNTNISGSINVINACLESKVKKVVSLSTDKASDPINLYGATKLVSDRLFTAANTYSGEKNPIFSIVRYGNVMGSRGSIIPFFLEQNRMKKNLTITHKDMTRFMIPLEEAVNLVWTAFTKMIGGEIFVKKIPSMKVLDIAKAINPNLKIKYIGIRPGEKIHEQMIATSDTEFTYEFKDYYIIIPSIYEAKKYKKVTIKSKKVKSNFSYTSDNNQEWMSSEELKHWIIKNQKKLIEI